MGRKPPSKPRKLKRRSRKGFYAQYWEDRVDEHGQVVERRQVQVPLYDEAGTRITTPRKADKACDALHHELLAAWSGETTGTTPLADYKERYLGTHGRRAGTARSYETKLRQFLDFARAEYGATRFSDVTREMIKVFLDARFEEVKLVTVHGDLRAIRAFFNEAVRDGRVADNPAKGVKLPSLHGVHASGGFFLPAEMDALVEHCKRNEVAWYPIIAGFRYAPFRREELCYLEWRDLDLNHDVIYIRDEKPAYGWRPERSGRTMDLHPTLRSISESMDQVGDLVFQHPDGGAFKDPITERRELGRKAWRKTKSLCEKLEFEDQDETGSWQRRFPSGAHLKAFRSGISCELQLKGVPLAYVQEQLGHHDQSMTLEHYSHLVPELMGSLTKGFMARLGDG